MACLAWIVLLLSLLGHAISDATFYSHPEKLEVDIGISLEVSPLHTPVDTNDTLVSKVQVLESRDTNEKPDPTNLGWIRRWAALGDSFTAGIGAGDLYSEAKEDWRCSRYDRSYPARLEQAIGDANFQFLACSGDRTAQIFEQAKKVEGELDFAILSGGGNDLCLSSIIKTCVFMPFQSEKACDDIIEKATQNLRYLLDANVRQVLKEMNNKMNQDGLVLYVLYAQFFNADTEKCGLDQDWTLIGNPIGTALPLTRDRRRTFNQLVKSTNGVLRTLIQDMIQKKELNYRIRVVDWDAWAQVAVRGQFCYPGTKGNYPDKGQPDLQFFKPNTAYQDHKELKRDVPVPAIIDPRVYDSVIYKSPNPAAGAMHQLDPRAPLPPGCPGDAKPDEETREKWEDSPTWDVWNVFDIGLPDSIGRFFHPNELGHTTIASFALQELYNARSEQLGIANPLCETYDKFECTKNGDGWAEDNSRRYAAVDKVVEAMDDFCTSQPGFSSDNPTMKQYKKTYYIDTPDQVRFELTMGQTGEDREFDTDQCFDSFNRITHGCDGLDPKNPMNFKFGGAWVRGPNKYRLTMDGSIRRPGYHDMPQKKSGKCTHRQKADTVRFTVDGVGFANWDFGQKTILPEILKCAQGAGNVKHWDFRYWQQGYVDSEWESTFEIPTFYFPVCIQVASNAAGVKIRCETESKRHRHGHDEI